MADRHFIFFILWGLIAIYGLLKEVPIVVVLPWILAVYAIYNYYKNRKSQD